MLTTTWWAVVLSTIKLQARLALEHNSVFSGFRCRLAFEYGIPDYIGILECIWLHLSTNQTHLKTLRMNEYVRSVFEA